MTPASEEEERLITGTTPKLPENFPYIRAWIVTAIGIILYMLSAITTVPVISQYIVQRLSDNSTEPDVSNSSGSANTSDQCKRAIHAPETQTIQKEAVNLLMYYSLVGCASAIAVNAVVGPLSDFIGRRILFVIPLLGLFAKCVIVSLIVKFNLNLDFMYLAFGIDGLCGSYFAILVAVFAFTADVTTPGNKRTIAIAIMEGCLAIAASVGQLIAGYLIKFTGYFYPMLMFALFAVLDLAIVFFLLPETRTEKRKANTSPIYNIKRVFSFYFTDGTLRKRSIYCVLMAMFFFSVISILGRSALETIYQLGEPFCWDSVKIGFYGALRLSVQFVFSILALKFLQSYLRDEVICIISTVSAIGGLILEALAYNGTMMYLVPVVGIIGSASVPIARSIMSKITPPNKQGALFASIAIVETVCNSASTTLYNLVYNATVEQFKGAVWLMVAGLGVVNIIFILVFICLSRGKSHHLYPTTEEVVLINDKSYGSTAKEINI